MNPSFRFPRSGWSSLRLLLYVQCILMLAFGAGCQSKKTIVNNLDEKEANEIIVFLASKGIESNKIQAAEGGGGGGSKTVMWEIAVDSSKSTEAMALLNMNGLPRRRGHNLLDIFNTGGLVPSDMQEKIKYQAGLAEQIASTIRKIDGVLDTDVQLSFPDEDPLNPQAAKSKVTAAVYVKHSGVLDDPNSHLVTKIKRLVASSINGLDFDNVTVIGDRARFADTSMLNISKGRGEEKEYVRIWTIVIGKESIARFRVVFFSFFLLTLLLGLNLLWVLWKCYPLLKTRGGIQQLFKLAALPDQPLVAPDPTEKKEEPATTDKDKTEEEPKKEGSQDHMETT